MSSLGNRIRMAREAKAMIQDQLAAAVGVSSGKVIWTWEKGSAKPDAEKLALLCEILDVTPSYILGYYPKSEFTLSEVEKDMIKRYRALDEHGKTMADYVIESEYSRVESDSETVKRKYRNIIYYSHPASAGTGFYLDGVNGGNIRVPVNSMTDDTDYIIPISGDSMTPDFHNGDKVCVRKQPQINIGDVGIFVVNSEVYIKELGQGRLISHNERYRDIILHPDDSVTCLGYVLGVLDETDFETA